MYAPVAPTVQHKLSLRAVGRLFIQTMNHDAEKTELQETYTPGDVRYSRIEALETSHDYYSLKKPLSMRISLKWGRPCFLKTVNVGCLRQ